MIASGEVSWQAVIHAEGHDFETNNPKDYYVTFGVAGDPLKEEAVTAIPPEATVVMYLYSPPFNPFISTALFKDIRPFGEQEYSWVVQIDPNGIYGPGAPLKSTLSWDPSELGAGQFELREGDDGSGIVVVPNMKSTSSYEITSADVLNFTIIYTP